MTPASQVTCAASAPAWLLMRLGIELAVLAAQGVPAAQIAHAQALLRQLWEPASAPPADELDEPPGLSTLKRLRLALARIGASVDASAALALARRLDSTSQPSSTL